MTTTTEVLRIDVDVNVPPYPRLGFKMLPGRRAFVNDPRGLAKLNEFYREIHYLLPRAARKKLEGPLQVRLWIWKTGRADLDNLVKSVLDAFTRS
ncbi:MAG: hypothetical protein ABIW84_01825, partial [Ilumatobacteraceae bacterium]